MAYFTPTGPEYELVGDDENAPATPQARSRRVHVAVASVLLCAAGAVFAVVAPNSTPLASMDETGAAAGLTLGITNEYGPLASKNLYPWKHLAEAHKESTLTAACAASCRTEALTFHWTVSHVDAASGAVVADLAASGLGLAAVSYTFAEPATAYTVTARAESKSGERVLRLSEQVVAKYVRREVRQLTTADRERYLAAAQVFHTLDAAAGRAAYGPKFTNYAESVQKHLQRMTLDGCTPFHGYDTFLTAHEAFVLEFEQALQAVDPRVSAPYWDYTIDSVKYGHAGNIAKQSVLFSNDWFGPIDNAAHSDVLTSTYFSNLPVPNDQTAPERNGFGFVTDSVNQNPSPFVTRAASICGLPTKASLAGCTELRAVFNARSLSALRTQIETVYHASLHMALGGVTHCPVSLKDAVADASMGGPSRAALFEALGLMANTVWRTLELGGLMRCDQGCDATSTTAFTSSSSSSSSSCSCSCPSVDAWDDSEKADLAYDQLDHLGVTQMLGSETATASFFTATASGAVRLRGATDSENANFWKWLVDFACHPGRMAPYATPLAANNDPLFWVSHASWGRFWHFVQLAPSFAEDFHNDFTDPTVKSFQDGYQNVSDCENMLKESDALPFKGFTLRASELSKDTPEYTNTQLLELFSASNPNLPYVYSDFDWSHCGSDLAF